MPAPGAYSGQRGILALIERAADFFQLVQLRAALDEFEQRRAVPPATRRAASARLDEVLARAREDGLAKAAELIRTARDEFLHVTGPRE